MSCNKSYQLSVELIKSNCVVLLNIFSRRDTHRGIKHVYVR